MGQLIYFTRHGKIPGTEDTLSEAGKEELLAISERLAAKGFRPRVAFATDKQRTVESAQCLAPAAVLMQDSRARINGTANMVRKYHADRILQWIKERTPKGAHALVVNHDCVPAVLALRYAEVNGATVDWEDEDLRYRIVKLQRGHGVLVSGKTYEFISP